MTITADAYIDRVLDRLPPVTPRREQIALELRGHIAERMASGHSIDTVLAQLGDPAVLAESYLTAVPLVSASLASRIAAKAIDLFVVMIVSAMLAGVISLAISLERLVPFIFLGAFVGASFLFAIYTMVAETRYGQTLGKSLMRIRVVRESGARISGGQAIVRQLPMFLQVYVIDVLFALFTEKSQRAFELLSKTRVVVALLLLSVAVHAQPVDVGPAPGRLIDIGGRMLHLHCTGSGSPTVVIEAGASSFAIDFALVQPEVARVTRVCSYDRAGHGWSDGTPMTTADRVVNDLHALLNAADITPPLVLVGASMGGLYTRWYQARYPSDVAGMVFIDPAHEDRLFTMYNGQAIAIAELTAEQLRSTIAVKSQEIPTRKPQTGDPFDRLPPDSYQRRLALDARLIAAMPASLSYDAIVERLEAERAMMAALRDARLKDPRPLGTRPVVSLSRGVNSSPAMQGVHASLATLTSNGRHQVIAGAGHEIHLFEPQAVIKAITEVVAAARK